MISIFRADPMTFTPFSVDKPLNEILATGGITFVDTPSKADIILARREDALQTYGSFNKAFAIWTYEPRFNYQRGCVANISGVRNPVHIMNAYNGTIYADKFYYFRASQLDFDRMMRLFADKPKRGVMLASYRRPPTPVLYEGRNIDLQEYRQHLGTHLLESGFCDIYGRNWPESTRISGNSREGAWRAAKHDILKSYAVNIAFENTIIPNYVTEKFWDAVVNACLPIYHGADNGIYEIFPEQCFIEASGKSVESLADQIVNMTLKEMQARYAACVRAYIDVYAKHRRKISRETCLVRTTRFLHYLLS